MIIKKIISLISAISLILFQKTFAQTFFQPQHYVCYQANGPVTIDGKADEAAWHQAAWTADFRDIEGDAKPQPPLPRMATRYCSDRPVRSASHQRSIPALTCNR